MTTSTPGALAVELHPRSPTHWADVTWTLHQRQLLTAPDPLESARWLEACSPDPDHPCYAGHQEWATELAAGYAAARAVHDTEVIEEPLSDQETQLLREDTLVVPAGQLSEWVLDDLKDETSSIGG